MRYRGRLGKGKAGAAAGMVKREMVGPAGFEPATWPL